ncbi:aspartate/glutamate racemase family protein [Nocardia sp. NPDC052566]|uniref:aspartate/glutamate racemase family protein n=1 Tax=Nocardia sp. NPDC052566 TaxID=3364330 RepID=UPI0037CB6C86
MGTQEHIIGILGGMGPAATADFYTKLVSLTPGSIDQEHPKVVIWADPTVPDRTLALTENGPDPTPWLLRGAEVLRAAGATLLAIPCNTAHAFLPPIASQLGMPLVHMIDQVARHISEMSPTVCTVGLLATSGTVRAQLYEQWLSRYGIDVLAPSPDVQSNHVMPAIRAVKGGDRGSGVTDRLAAAANHLVTRGAQLVVAGCTEIPLGLPAAAAPCPVIDPATVLVRALLAQTSLGDSRVQ